MFLSERYYILNNSKHLFNIYSDIELKILLNYASVESIRNARKKFNIPNIYHRDLIKERKKQDLINEIKEFLKNKNYVLNGLKGIIIEFRKKYCYNRYSCPMKIFNDVLIKENIFIINTSLNHSYYKYNHKKCICKICKTIGNAYEFFRIKKKNNNLIQNNTFSLLFLIDYFVNKYFDDSLVGNRVRSKKFYSLIENELIKSEDELVEDFKLNLQKFVGKKNAVD